MKYSKFYFTALKSNNTKDKICLSCSFKKIENKLVCGMCKTIRSIRPSDYIRINKLNFFSIFNFKDEYSIDKSQLDRQYKNLQKNVHPDKYAHETEDVLKEAQEVSSYLSQAYQTLKDDFNRANYLLKLKGFPNIEEDAKSIYSVSFLEEMFEIQERIEECASKEELLKIKTDLMETISWAKRDLEVAFDKNELQNVQNILKTIKFHLTVLEHVNDKL